MRAPKKTAKKTAFVPRMIFKAAAVVAVIPVCACGGTVIDPESNDGGPDVILPSVGAMLADGGDHFVFGVAVECFDGAGDPCHVLDAGSDIEFIVAAHCFDGGGGDCPPEAGVADVAFADVTLGVAADAFATPDATKK